MKNTNTLLIAAVALLATGCNKDKQKGIAQIYQVSYNEGLDTTTLQAFFYEGDFNGTYKHFDDPAVVKVNGEASTAPEEFVGRQNFKWSLKGMQEVVITVPGKKSSLLTNKVDRAMMGDFHLEMDSVFHVTDTIRAKWTGADVTPEDHVGIQMNRVYDSTSRKGSSVGDFKGGHSCTFKYEETSKFDPGKYLVMLSKSRETEPQQKDGKSPGKLRVDVVVYKKVVVK